MRSLYLSLAPSFFPFARSRLFLPHSWRQSRVIFAIFPPPLCTRHVFGSVGREQRSNLLNSTPTELSKLLPCLCAAYLWFSWPRPVRYVTVFEAARSSSKVSFVGARAREKWRTRSKEEKHLSMPLPQNADHLHIRFAFLTTSSSISQAHHPNSRSLSKRKLTKESCILAKEALWNLYLNQGSQSQINALGYRFQIWIWISKIEFLIHKFERNPQSMFPPRQNSRPTEKRHTYAYPWITSVPNSWIFYSTSCSHLYLIWSTAKTLRWTFQNLQ